MGSVISRAGLVLLDDYDQTARIAGGRFDKLDITASLGDIRYQVLTPNGDWQPADGVLVRAGVFKSVPGYTELFPPGPTQVQFKRATAGVPAKVDVDIFAPDA